MNILHNYGYGDKILSTLEWLDSFFLQVVRTPESQFPLSERDAKMIYAIQEVISSDPALMKDLQRFWSE